MEMLRDSLKAQPPEVFDRYTVPINPAPTVP